MVTELEMPDLAALRESLGLPPLGVKLDREQSLRWLAARDAARKPIPPEVSDWTRRLLGLPAGTPDDKSAYDLMPGRTGGR